MESDRERIISGLESLRKQISGMREEEMSVFLKLKAVEDTMRKPKEEGGF